MKVIDLYADRDFSIPAMNAVLEVAAYEVAENLLTKMVRNKS